MSGRCRDDLAGRIALSRLGGSLQAGFPQTAGDGFALCRDRLRRCTRLGHAEHGDRQAGEERPVHEHGLGRPGVEGPVVGKDQWSEVLVARHQDRAWRLVHDLRGDGSEEHRLPAPGTPVADDDEVGRHLAGLVHDHAGGAAVEQGGFDRQVGPGGSDLVLGAPDRIPVDPDDTRLGAGDGWGGGHRPRPADDFGMDRDDADDLDPVACPPRERGDQITRTIGSE